MQQQERAERPKMHKRKASRCCIDIAKECQSSSAPISCIYIVDKRIRDQKPDAYTPDTVSIGPYHRDRKKENRQMQAMEALKSRYVEALVDRTGISREGYKEAIRAIKPDPCEYYFDRFDLPDEEEFLQVMLVDGLFIIELFRKYAKAKAIRDAKQSAVHEVDADEESGVEVDADDPIFYSSFKRGRVIRDLILLENQIPMSVLQALFDLSGNPKPSLAELALDFFYAMIPVAKGKYASAKEKKHKHLLDLLSFALEGSVPSFMDRSSISIPKSLPSTTELRHSGVNFKRCCSTNVSLMDLKFKNGVFEIPQIHVCDCADPIFRNLIAYEQHRYEGSHCMTSYTLLMAYLINSAADVAILRDNDIIVNHLGDDNKVASLFNDLDCIFTNKFIYAELCDDVHKYYRCFWNHWKASLQRDFCNSPWTIIPVVAAVILLILTLWSAIFATFPVFKVTF